MKIRYYLVLLYIMTVVVNLNHYLGINLDHSNNYKGVYFLENITNLMAIITNDE